MTMELAVKKSHTTTDEAKPRNSERRATTHHVVFSWLRSTKATVLAALTIQNVSLVLMVRLSRVRSRSGEGEGGSKPVAIASTVVMTAEMLKILLNVALERILVRNNNGYAEDSCSHEAKINAGDFTKGLVSDLISIETLRLFVPGLFYVIQNNLLFIALGNLPVPLYQVTNQGKLVATALCSRLLLGRRFSWSQYASLAILAIGVAVTQLSRVEANSSSLSKIKNDGQNNRLLGLSAMLVSAFTSGFAGVYFEKILKEKTPTKTLSVYARNIQLALWGAILGVVAILLSDLDEVRTRGFFVGYDVLVWGVVTNQAVGGLLVSLVMKHADTVLKVFSTSLSIVVATAISVKVFEDKVDWTFLLGMTLVLVAVVFYSQQSSPSPVGKTTHQFKTGVKRFITRMLPGLILFLAVGYFFTSNLVYLNYAGITPALMLDRDQKSNVVPLPRTTASNNKVRSILQGNRTLEQKVGGLAAETKAPGRVPLPHPTASINKVRTRSCKPVKIDMRYHPHRGDVHGWMARQRMDGSVLVEDHHDQYALTSNHRIKHLAVAGSELKNDAERKAAIENILWHVGKELDSLNVPYVLWSGTLLGAYRHHAMIPWDDDVDIALSMNDTIRLRDVMVERARSDAVASSSAKRAENPHHLQWVIRAEKDSDIIVGKVADLRNGYYVDIFTLHEDPADPTSDLVGTYWVKPRCFPRAAIFPTRPCVFGKHVYQCPQDPKTVLKINYPSGLGVPPGKKHPGAVFEGLIDRVET